MCMQKSAAVFMITWSVIKGLMLTVCKLRTTFILPVTCFQVTSFIFGMRMHTGWPTCGHNVSTVRLVLVLSFMNAMYVLYCNMTARKVTLNKWYRLSSSKIFRYNGKLQTPRVSEWRHQNVITITALQKVDPDVNNRITITDLTVTLCYSEVCGSEVTSSGHN